MLPTDTILTPQAFASAEEPARSLSLRRGVGLALFGSGFASLVYQVIWQRVLTQEIGVDAVSVAVIVTIFLAGLGLGASAGGWLCARREVNLPRAYALLEAFVGLFGLVSIRLLRGFNQWAASNGLDSIPADLFINAIVLLPPTLAMGMTTPIAIELVSTRRRDVCTSIGVFYGVNTIGGAAGALTAGFILVEWLGLSGATSVAGGLNLFVAALVAMVGAGQKRPGMSLQVGCGRRVSALGMFAVLACAAFGFVTLAYETALFRIMSFHFESHVYVFPLVLGTVLVAMGTGDALAGVVADRLGPRGAANGLAGLLAMLAAGTACVLMLPGPQLAHNWPSRAACAGFVVAAMVPMAIQAAFFPAAARLVTGHDRVVGTLVGGMLFWYAVGNVLGCYLTAFVLLPTVGTIGTVAVTLLVAGAGTAALLLKRRAGSTSWASLGAALLATLAACLLLPRRYYETSRQLAAVLEGPEGVVSYRDGKVQGGVQVNGTPAAQVYKSTTILRRREHDLSLLTHVDPSFAPESVLIVGLGSGNFPWALREHPTIRLIRIIELSPRVIDLVSRHSDPTISEALRDPRVCLEVGDGRRYLRGVHSRGERYDLIQIGTFYPDVAGSANLYSRDLMNTARNCLTPGGYFMTLDCAGIAATGLDVFRHGMLIEGMPHYMFFFDHTLPRPTTAAQLGSEASAGVRLLRREMFAGYGVNSDDCPWLEFRLLRYLSGDAPNLRARLHKMDAGFFDLPSPQAASN